MNKRSDKGQGTRDQEETSDKGPGTRDQEKTCAQCDEYLTGLKRALADYDNLKKDLSRERAQMHVHAVERSVLAILPVLDNFDAAFKFAPTEVDPKTKQWLQGVLHVRTQLEDALKELGLDPFGEVGEAFDPLRHEAGAERSEEGKPPNTVLEVVRRGWRLGDRVIRPAKVIINNFKN